MSLRVFHTFLTHADSAVSVRGQWPSTVDPLEVESALVGYGFVLLHAAMEQCIRNAIDRRCDRCNDPEVKAAAKKFASEKSGKLGIKFLNESLDRFSRSYRDAFSIAIAGLSNSWDSVINQRHQLAHGGQPVNATLPDLKKYYGEVQIILGHFCRSLGLTNSEIQNICPLIR